MVAFHGSAEGRSVRLSIYCKNTNALKLSNGSRKQNVFIRRYWFLHKLQTLICLEAKQS